MDERDEMYISIFDFITLSFGCRTYADIVTITTSETKDELFVRRIQNIITKDDLLPANEFIKVFIRKHPISISVNSRFQIFNSCVVYE
jgi:hypothetical protein